MDLLDKVKTQLSIGIDSSIVDNLIGEYEHMKRNFFLDDSESTIKNAGRFVELSMAAIKFIKDKKVIDLNNIQFGKLFEEFEKIPKTSPEDDLLYLAIPRTSTSVYTLRSKKKVAHFKLIDPVKIDAVYVVTACDWVLASLIFYLHKQDISDEITSIIQSITKKQVPLVEEFEGGDLLVLKKMDFSEEILVVLFKINERISKAKLREIAKPPYPQIFTTTLANLKNGRLIHENGTGIKITSEGIIEAEKIILKYKSKS